MRVIPMPAPCWRFAATAWLMLLLATVLSPALAQSRLERSGVTLYWGLVPAAVVAEKHALAELHGGPPKGGGQVHHLVVALYDSASGRRIEDAVVRAQLSEAGIVDEPAKYLPPMKVNDQASYGQVFGTANEGPYRFRVWVRVPQRSDEIEFAVKAWSPHRNER
ncbi:hypothetical protein [Methylibium petroleiphilum]